MSGKLAENILYFARALRDAGMPVGPGAVLDAITAVEVAQIGGREDFYATLHAVFVKKHEHSVLFAQAFDIFWKRRGFMDKLIAMLSPMAEPKNQQPQKAEAGASRVADALFKAKPREEKPKPSLDLDARFTMSAHELLQRKDFAQMSAAEMAEAERAIDRLILPDDAVKMRRLVAASRGRIVDPRRSFRQSLKIGGPIALAHRAPALRHPPVVALCDISGSMSEYTRIFLHFLHTLTARRRVHTFLFGTRLTNVTRALRARDIDAALARCSIEVHDWAGGTRIATSLHRFNRDWSRRVLGQGAIVLLFTDGLERDPGPRAPSPQAGGTPALPNLSAEMERLNKSCRRLVWLNPLLRFDGFEAKASGIRAMLPFADEFRPIHNMLSMAQLVRALTAGEGRDADPKAWLKRVS
ncbi:vWA domain-containing protein [Methylovirgula sp. 4M-Z18]|uniref:vWA domain-containing protein n=1 Tax=Methylovirgula sp. 4M-Z18 TaxID=2293567 RepID=UPI000E2E6644|nr:VWA domain-containing protein [Methylovirgula sp. 4M-Z18]RFB78975.1 VWA domain-containing protein [Methylovirgula sp. 4M-Z18]